MIIKAKYPYYGPEGRVIKEREIKITWWQWLKCRILDLPIYIETGRLSDTWKGDLPLYLIYCEIHGFVLTYPQGFEGKLRCLLCAIESEAKLKEVLSVK